MRARSGADEPESGKVPERASLEGAQRVIPTWTEPLAAAASKPIGGPLGRHAAVGTHWLLSPLRVVLLLAVVALTFGWFAKAACIQEGDNGGLDWSNSRQYVAMCYSDVIPLYGVERLNRADFMVYRDGWLQLTKSGGGKADVTIMADGDGYRVEGGAEAVDAGGLSFTLNDGDRIALLEDNRLELAGGRTVTLRAGDEPRFMEYPPLTGLFQWANATLTRAWQAGVEAGFLPGAIPVAIYFNLTALFLAFAWLTTVWAVARINRRRPWDAVLVAISPLVVVHAFTNFDALATAFAIGAILAWARRRPLLAGVLIGLGASAKMFPIFLLGPLLVLCLRSGKLREWGAAAAGAVGALLAVNVPLALAFPDGWGEFLRLNNERGIDPDTLYNVVRSLTSWEGFDGPLAHNETPVILNTVTFVLFALCCLVVAYIALSAPVRPRLAQLCFLVVAAFLITNKVWSPQFSLWLVPLAALAIPRWRLLLGWMTIDALVWAPRMMYYLGVDDKGLPIEWFLGAVVLRDLAVIGLCALVIHQIYRPSTDVVRRYGDDDPAGGVFDRAPDAFTIPGLRELRQRRDSRRKEMSSA